MKFASFNFTFDSNFSAVENERMIYRNEMREAESSLFFWKIFESNQMAIAVTDRNGKIENSNRLFFKKLIDVAHPIDTQSVLSELLNSTASEYKLAHHNGDENINLTIIDAAHLSQRFLWVINQDDSAALKSLYNSFVETSFELIFRSSIQKKVLYANHLFLTRFGLADKSKVDDIKTIFEDPHHYDELEQRLLAEKEITGETVFFKKTDGTRLTGLVNCHLHIDEKDNTIFNWLILDISKQVESESILKSQNEQLDKVNHQMERFLYSTSHDLRSPITSILGLINLVRMDSHDRVALDYISKIEASTLKLDKIIHDILSFSRVTYQRVTSERIDFEPLLWKTIDNHKMNLQSRKIHFEVNLQGENPFYGDFGRIEIILDNIIRNAIQFYDVNKVRPFLKIDVKIDVNQVQMEFIDNGIGIGKQHLQDVFNMFYKASHLSKGAGLGLFIVRETLEKLGGTISVEAEIGFGTAVRLVIPNDRKGKLIGRKLQLQHQNAA